MNSFLKKSEPFKIYLSLILTVLLVQRSTAQHVNYVGGKGNFYASWGYNKEWYTASNIHINQPSLGNDYTFVNIIGKDKPGWDEKSIFKQPLTIPQYNYRIGYWFKDNWAFEINFDHTKYQVEQQQLLHVKGTMNHAPIDTYMINRGKMLWQLNNGANFFLFNIVHRKQIPHLNFKNFNASLLLKGGIGFMVPHVENTIFGKDNNPGFQFGGFDIGVEAALRLSFFKYAFVEFSNKAVYVRYFGLKIYEGKAKQAFGCYELVGSIGASFPIKNFDKKAAQ
jgi:hypothetical protein